MMDYRTKHAKAKGPAAVRGSHAAVGFLRFVRFGKAAPEEEKICAAQKEQRTMVAEARGSFQLHARAFFCPHSMK